MTMEELVAKYMENQADCGGAGRAFETAVRAAIIHTVERTHPQGISDIKLKTTAKHIATIECKSGCGWLIHPKWETKEEAEEELDSFKMPKAEYVCYIVKFTGNNLEDARLMTQASFLRILRENGLVRVKRDKNTDQWGIVIQSYVPTPTFRASKTRYEKVMDSFANCSLSIEEWMQKKGLA